MIALRPFQRRFLRAATAPGIRTAALSLPRGNGKSWLAGHLCARILTPGDKLYREGLESVLMAASIEQARIVAKFVRASLGEADYSYTDSATRVAIRHKATRTRLRVIGSNGRTAMGLVDCPWVIADEPGAWEVRGGELMHDAIETALGKPGSPLRVLYIGTLAPAEGGWWHDLVGGGSSGTTHVTALQGDLETWDRWPTIRKANPLTAVSADFRARLIEERDAARRDSRLKARFLSYRLNLPSEDEVRMLLTADDWRRVLAREVGARDGQPYVGVDLGGSRSWSAAVAVWPSGRCEALAVTAGMPSIADQEERDRVPTGQYRRLVEAGALLVAEGLRVPPPSMLVDAALERWGEPAGVWCDRYRQRELADALDGRAGILTRVGGFKDSTEDIRGLRRLALDGPLSVPEDSRALLTLALQVGRVVQDSHGNERIRRAEGSTVRARRDDVAVALSLAGGAHARNAHLAQPLPWFIAGA